MPSKVGVNPGVMHDAVELNGLIVRPFFDKDVNAGGGQRIRPRGAILDGAGRRVLSVVLKLNGAEVARCTPQLPSPKMRSDFPDHPHSSGCGFLIDFNLAQNGIRTYSLVADIEDVGECEVARPSIYVVRGQLDLEEERLDHPDILEEEFWELIPTVWPFAFQDTPRLYNLYSALAYVFRTGIPGDFIECGVFMGGCVMMMAEMCKRHDRTAARRVFALDTFSGFVRVDATLDVDVRTGEKLSNKVFTDFFDKSSENMKTIDFDRLHIVQGDVLETIPKLDIEKIAVLRLDTDTYDTTKFELENLHDRVTIGGVVIIDDYGYTPGCRKAVDDFCHDKNIFPQRIDWEYRSWVKAGAHD